MKVYPISPDDADDVHLALASPLHEPAVVAPHAAEFASEDPVIKDGLGSSRAYSRFVRATCTPDNTLHGTAPHRGSAVFPSYSPELGLHPTPRHPAGTTK